MIAGIVADVVTLLLVYGPNFGIYIVKPTPESYGLRALSFMEYGYYSE